MAEFTIEQSKPRSQHRGFLLQRVSPDMALSGHRTHRRRCPLLGVKRTLHTGFDVR